MVEETNHKFAAIHNLNQTWCQNCAKHSNKKKKKNDATLPPPTAQASFHSTPQANFQYWLHKKNGHAPLPTTLRHCPNIANKICRLQKTINTNHARKKTAPTTFTNYIDQKQNNQKQSIHQQETTNFAHTAVLPPGWAYPESLACLGTDLIDPTGGWAPPAEI